MVPVESGSVQILVITAAEHSIMHMIGLRVQESGQGSLVAISHLGQHDPIITGTTVFGKVMNLTEEVRTLFGQGEQGSGEHQTLAQAVVVDMPDIRWASQCLGSGSEHLRCQCQRRDRRTDRFVLQAGDDPERTGEIERGRLAGEDDSR